MINNNLYKMVTEEIILTTVYSTALLSAILHFLILRKVDLPIERPITVEQVQKFIPDVTGQMAGSLFLTNNAWFHFSKQGFVDSFRAPKNWFAIQELDDIPFYYGKSTLTTNEIIEFALETVSKSGYHITLNNHKDGGTFRSGKREHVPWPGVEWYRGNEGAWTEPSPV